MRIRRSRAIIVTGLIAGTMALTACTPTAPEEEAVDLPIGAIDLAAAGCPTDLKIQTDWNPQAEHGHLYELLGERYTVDSDAKTVTGPLLASGEYTGINVTVASGGPAIGFSQPNAQMYADDSIFMGYVGTDEAIAQSEALPTVGVFAPLEKDPQIIMWDPATYPDVETIADLGRTGAIVRVFPGGTFIDYFVGIGALTAAQIDPTYDGQPAVFVSEGGKVAQQGYASAEPYIYEFEVAEWGKPVNYQLVNDAGYPKYASVMSVKPATITKYANCLTALVPVLQQATLDYYTAPNATNQLVLELVETYDTGWVYSQGVADYSVATQLSDGIAANGPDSTVGNLDEARMQQLFDIVVPIYTAAGLPVLDGLRVENIYTNQFIDPSIGF